MQAARIASAVAVSLTAVVATFVAHVPAKAQDLQKLFVEGDIVRGNTPLGATGPICVLTSQFKRGENVVFRIECAIRRASRSTRPGIKSIEVELADGRKLPTRYGGHPPRQPTDFFWTAAWMIPENYPTARSATASRRPTWRQHCQMGAAARVPLLADGDCGHGGIRQAGAAIALAAELQGRLP